jgi:hypothetical protein
MMVALIRKIYGKGAKKCHTMYNFLEKLVTIISFYDYPVKIQRNSIQLSMAMLQPIYF